MNDQQIAETATLIMEEFPNLTIADVKLFIRRLKCNAYGEVYDLDGQSFFGWMRKYIEERNQANYQITQQLQKEAKERREKEEEEFSKTPEGQKVQKESLRLFDEVIKSFSNKESKKVIGSDDDKKRIEKIRKDVIAKNFDRVMKDCPERYLEIMTGLINDALKAEGLM